MFGSLVGALGIIIGAVSLSGLGVNFSSIMVKLAGGSLIIVVFLCFLASFVLGMGLPVTAAYIVLSLVAGPALVEMGVPLVAAHLMIIWFSQDSSFTPPVCVGSYVAASISGGDPWKTGLRSIKIAKSYILIGSIMAFRPILFTSTAYEAWISLGILFLSVLALTFSVDGYFLCRLNKHERILMLIAAVLLILPNTTADITGIVLFLVATAFHIIRYLRMKKNVAMDL